MSSVFVHVGQAGCQMGQLLWPALAQERPGSPEFFYSRQGDASTFCPRAVLVDAEPKVVQTMLRLQEPYQFDSSDVAFSQSGRGGNFAMGYLGSCADHRSGLQTSLHLLDQGLESTRRQVERCFGAYRGAVVMHSLGGGTGSGLGTRLVEELRDVYPRSPLFSVCALPLVAGENPAQCFNATFSLSALQELVDGIVVYENDHLLTNADAARPLLDADGSKPTFRGARAHCAPGSLSAMNSIITRDLVPFLCPPPSSVPFDISELVASVCPMPTHRFVQAFSGEVRAPHGSLAQELPLFNALAGSMPRVWRSSAKGGTIAAQVVLRGFEPPNGSRFRQDLVEKLGCVSWQPFFEMRSSACSLTSAPGVCRASLVVNWKHVAQILTSLISRSRNKYASRAFVHWYERYGFGAAEFEHAFELLEHVVQNYQAV